MTTFIPWMCQEPIATGPLWQLHQIVCSLQHSQGKSFCEVRKWCVGSKVSCKCMFEERSGKRSPAIFQSNINNEKEPCLFRTCQFHYDRVGRRCAYIKIWSICFVVFVLANAPRRAILGGYHTDTLEEIEHTFALWYPCRLVNSTTCKSVIWLEFRWAHFHGRRYWDNVLHARQYCMILGCGHMHHAAGTYSSYYLCNVSCKILSSTFSVSLIYDALSRKRKSANKWTSAKHRLGSAIRIPHVFYFTFVL